MRATEMSQMDVTHAHTHTLSSKLIADIYNLKKMLLAVQRILDSWMTLTYTETKYTDTIRHTVTLKTIAQHFTLNV